MSDLSDAIDALTPDRYYVLGTDSSGTMVDRGTDGTNGTWTDQPTFSQAPILGGSSAGATFNGTSDRGTFTCDLGSGDWTLAIVATVGGGTGGHPNRDFMWATLFASSRLAAIWETNNLTEAYIGPGSGGRQVNVTKDSDPHLWIVRYHPEATTGYWELWKDGTLVDSETGNITYTVPTTHYVGTDYTGNAQHWNGSLSDLAIWVGTALSESDIEDLWTAAQGSGPVTASARVTQAVRSTLTSGTPAARVTQAARVVLVANVPPDDQRSEVVWRD